MKKSVQFCPKCGSTNIRSSLAVHYGDPAKSEGFVGWDCLDCGYTGKDFFIVSGEEYKKLYKEKFSKTK